MILEKPFGKDRQSCNELLSAIKTYWNEDETFRVEYYLGKSMVKNLLVLRFANTAYNSGFDKNSISNVQIAFKESLGTEGRGGSFDGFGIIRDVIQNHLLQVLSILTMERPPSFSPEDIRDEKVKVLREIRSIERNDTLLAQYTGANGKPGYLDDDTVPQDSVSPTFAAVTLWINNSRWDGVPFILIAGKAVNESKAEIRIQYKDVTEGIFRGVTRNELVIRIQPTEAIYMKTNIMNSNPLLGRIPDAYELLLLDVFRGDRSNFVRDDELDEAWKIFTPILHWIDGRDGPAPRPLKYPYGSSGSKELKLFVYRYHQQNP